MTEKQSQFNLLFNELYQADEQLFQLHNKMQLLNERRNKWADDMTHKLQNVKTRLSSLTTEHLASQPQTKQTQNEQVDNSKQSLHILNAMQETLRFLNAAQDTIALPDIILGHVRAGRLRQLCISAPFIIDAAQALGFDSRQQQVRIIAFKLAFQFIEAPKNQQITKSEQQNQQSEYQVEQCIFNPLSLSKEQFNSQFDVAQALILYIGSSCKKNQNIQLQQNDDINPSHWNKQLYDQYIKITKIQIDKMIDNSQNYYSQFIENFFNIEAKPILVQNTTGSINDDILDVSTIVSKFALISRSCGDAISKMVQFIQNNVQNSVYSNIQHLYDITINLFEIIIVDVLSRSANTISSTVDKILQFFQVEQKFLKLSEQSQNESKYSFQNISSLDINQLLLQQLPRQHQNQFTDAAITLYQLSGRLSRVIQSQIEKSHELLLQELATEQKTSKILNSFVKKPSTQVQNEQQVNEAEKQINDALILLKSSSQKLLSLYQIEELHYIYTETFKQLRSDRSPHLMLYHALQRSKKIQDEYLAQIVISTFCCVTQRFIKTMQPQQLFDILGCLRAQAHTSFIVSNKSCSNTILNNDSNVATQTTQFQNSEDKSLYHLFTYDELVQLCSRIEQELKKRMTLIIENYLSKRPWFNSLQTLLSTEPFEEQLIDIDGLEELKDAFDAPYGAYAYRSYANTLQVRAEQLENNTFLSVTDIRELGKQADKLQEHFREVLRAPVANEFRWLRELLQRVAVSG